MKKCLLVVSLLAFIFVGTSFAAPPENATDVLAHLETMGYDVSMDSKRIRATHSKEINLLIKKYRDGMLFTAFFGGTDYAKENVGRWLPLINKLNAGAAAARYYVDDDGDMVIEGYYPGQYNRKSFSAFLKAFNLERDSLADMIDKLGKYLE